MAIYFFFGLSIKTIQVIALSGFLIFRNFLEHFAINVTSIYMQIPFDLKSLIASGGKENFHGRWLMSWPSIFHKLNMLSKISQRILLLLPRFLWISQREIILPNILISYVFA